MDPQDLLMTAARTTLVYFVLLFVVRVLGKREVGNFTAFDLITALMLGEVVDEIAFGDVTLAKGFLAIALVAIWHLVNSWASYKSRVIDHLTGAEPTVLVADGKIQRDALARERMNESDLLSELRLNSVDEEELEEVKRATLEPNGQLSVIKHDWAKPLQRGDLKPAPKRSG